MESLITERSVNESLLAGWTLTTNGTQASLIMYKLIPLPILHNNLFCNSYALDHVNTQVNKACGFTAAL